MPSCVEVVVIPRLISAPLEPIPRKVKFVLAAASGKLRFVWAAIRASLQEHFDLVVVGHINLAALGLALARVRRARTALVVHGIDAWSRHDAMLVRASLARFDRIVGVSDLTLERFEAWSAVDPQRFCLLQNCVDLARFAPGPRPVALAQKLGLEDRKVIMTLGRLAGEERSKGFDEIIEALPDLALEVPDITYLICGDGPDRVRLDAKASQLGVRDRVVFAGFVAEDSKAEYYRLADAFVMPSRGEGFGIVLLEAMACGIPVVASNRDGGREALRQGELGMLVDPADRDALGRAIRAALARPKGVVPDGLGYFSVDQFSARAHRLVGSLLSDAVPPFGRK